MRDVDTKIQEAVEHELAWDTRLDGNALSVAVTDGVVTLKGVCRSRAEQHAAQEAARHVAGVLDVANEISVRPAQDLPDAEIAAAVRRALEWDSCVDHTRIHSSVNAGQVTLTGTVDTVSQRDDAEHAISRLNGVIIIRNAIDVKPLTRSAAEVRRSIESALERRAHREASRVRIDVDEGHVSLSGHVYSWAERSAVVGAVKGTRGVASVEDRMTVLPSALVRATN